MNLQQLIEEADRCVKCGLCLPHCPTYRLTRDEGDSPRGRIALIQAQAGGHLDGARLQRHLDRCLACRLCEGACPSGVRYGAMIDGHRALHPPGGRLRQLQRWLLATLPYRGWSGSLLRLYRRNSLRRLARWLGGRRWQRLDRLLPAAPTPAPLRTHYPADGARRGRVGLFTGCVGRVSERAALDAAIRVLNRLGIEVLVPAGQGCCGALHAHGGDPDAALQRVRRNRAVFDHSALDAVLHLASGCAGQLQRLATPVLPVSHYLQQLDWSPALQLAPLESRVLLHTPCSLRPAAAQPHEVAALLRRIPGIDLQELPAEGCCGAAGSYLLNQPAVADALRDQVAGQIATRADATALLVTSNTGCALQLATASGCELLHPVQLIDRQMA